MDLKAERGFTFAELLIVMLIVGVLAVFALPRLFDSDAFAARATRDFLGASLRYAQKSAIAMRRNVCVTVGSTSMTVTYAANPGSTQSCSSPLLNPANGRAFSDASNDYPRGTTVAAPATLVFDALGRPLTSAFVPYGSALTVTVNGYPTPLVVEAETGYVH